jgi:hypothetical protein
LKRSRRRDRLERRYKKKDKFRGKILVEKKAYKDEGNKDNYEGKPNDRTHDSSDNIPR